MKKKAPSDSDSSIANDVAGRDDWLSTREASVKLSCSLSQVQKMVEGGILSAWKTSGGHRRIPVSEIERVLGERDKGIGGGPADSQFRILVAEDDEATLKLYSRKFSSWNLPIEIISATDGYSAILLMAKQKPHLVIMDLRMPRMDGYQAIKAIRSDKDFDRVEIIVITGAAGVQPTSNLPPDVVVFKKPVDFAKLNGYVEACLHRYQGSIAGRAKRVAS